MPPSIPNICIQTPVALAKSLFTPGRSSSSCASIASTRNIRCRHLRNSPTAQSSLSLGQRIPRQFTYFSSMALDPEEDDDNDNVNITDISRSLHDRHDHNDVVPNSIPLPGQPHPRPRLEALRKRLQNNNDKIPAPTLKKSVKVSSSKESSSSSTSPSPSTLSWQDLLALSKSQYESEEPQLRQPILEDSYARKHSYLRISLVERCNLRCRYCMPPDGVPLQSQDKLLDADEVDRLTTLFGSNGVDKVRLTGGEPLLRKDIASIITKIPANPNINSVGITTNAITLSRQLPALTQAGLTHANISLDTLIDEKFQDVTRRKGLKQVLKAIQDSCKALPQGNVKLNCVVMKGFNDDELRDFIYMTKDLPLDVRFIEWMPFNNNGWSNNRFLSYADMMERIQSDEVQSEDNVTGKFLRSSTRGLPPMKLLREEDGPNDTTKWWKVAGHVGRVGFITSMSEHFCGTCNRMRITADGQLKVCLFGSAEVSLRDAMRGGASDEDLGFIIKAALQKKKFALGGHGSAEGIEKANDNRPMTLIGG